jgi:hypothetical protein
VCPPGSRAITLVAALWAVMVPGLFSVAGDVEESEKAAFNPADPTAAALLKVVLAQPPGESVSNLVTEYMANLTRAFAEILKRGVAVGAVRSDLPIELLARVSFAMGEAMDRWTLERWDELSPDELTDLPRAMLAMHMRALAPLPLVAEWERYGGRAPQEAKS